MTKLQNTSYIQNEFSKNHRLLGKNIYGTDCDMMEYTYKNGQIEFVAIIDHKHGTAESLSLKWSPMQAQLTLADKLDVPFFVAVDYLDADRWSIPAYYVIPANHLAKMCLSTKEAGGQAVAAPGVWHTVRAFSKLMHHIRGISWNPNEKLVDGKGRSLPNTYGATTLGELPDESTTYPLTILEIK